MTYATHGWSDLLDCSVRIEVKLLDLCRTVLVEVWRELIVVIEEIPLALVVHDAVVVCPAAVLVLCHDDALVLVWTHRVLAHCISENLSVVSYVWICEVEVAVVLECERTLSLAARKTLEAVCSDHFHLAVAPLHHLSWVVLSKLDHVVLEFCAAAVAPEDVCVSVRREEDARVDSVDALDRLRINLVWSLRIVGDCHTYCEAAVLHVVREVEIVLAVLLDAVRCPH